MKEHKIDLFGIPCKGDAVSEMKDGVFSMTVNRAHPLHHCKPNTRCVHYAEIPGRFRIPLRIDITVKMDVPSLYVVLGEGHLNIDGHSQSCIYDICEPHTKVHKFDSSVPMNEWFQLSLIYTAQEMQILINGEERYYANRERYMKSPLFQEMNREGFPLKISCVKRARIDIQSIRIMTYDEDENALQNREHQTILPLPSMDKPRFENCIALLPKPLHVAVTDMDIWLKSLRPMKFKRQITKAGDKISYVASDQGFSYAIHISESVMYHTLQWYILTQGKPEFWGRKDNRMEETLQYLAQSDPAYAKRLFHNLYECMGGYGPGCLARSPYTFDNKTIVSCHGKMYFTMNASEFDDAKRFINTVNELALNRT